MTRKAPYTRLTKKEQIKLYKEYNNTDIKVRDLAAKYNIALSSLYRIIHRIENPKPVKKKKIIKNRFNF